MSEHNITKVRFCKVCGKQAKCTAAEAREHAVTCKGPDKNGPMASGLIIPVR